ncbi:MAG: methyltransferase domain-containing protein [Candidatus Falkowbacteria bacterium]|nr:methyltransferase domain-containing protein [Candidatus Falkowbacteria bacterium]
MKPEQAEKLLNLVKRNYQEIAASFDATRKKEIWPKIRELADAVLDGDCVLDAGCGNGRLLEALKNKKIKYLGLDNSAELIKAASKNYPLHEFREADILDLANVPEKDFDHIFCLAVWQHIPGEELRVKFLKNLAAKIKPSGRIIISVWNLGRLPKYRKMILKNYWRKFIGRYELEVRDLIFSWKNSSGQSVSERYYHVFTLREIKRLSAIAGLKIIEINRDRHNIWVRY